MLCEKTLDFLVAGAGGLQPCGEFVVGQVRGQRVVAQGLGVAQVRPLVALGECAFGLVVVLALLGDVGGVGSARGGGAEHQAGNEVEQAAAHETSGQLNHEKVTAKPTLVRSFGS